MLKHLPLITTFLTALPYVRAAPAPVHSRNDQQCQYEVTVASTSPYSIEVKSGSQVVAVNNAILVGGSNNTVQAVSASSSGIITNNGGQVSATLIQPNVVKVQVNSSQPFTGAEFTAAADSLFYGTFEYPFFDSLTNTNVSFDLKGLGNSDGINWDNARAPFFLTNAGYGVYADTLDMGSYQFTTPGLAEFIFNTSSLTYYIILPTSTGDYKSILQTWGTLSSTIEMPLDSGYGPTFWSDNFEQDFHGDVTNAQENYYDVINHLYYNQIHATSMFADRPYGTGNSSWGNFDFDPVYYPTPAEFIANLSYWGFDFQVWVANRAFLDTELYNVSVANNWLFPGIDPVEFLGPALNLSIPEAYAYLKSHISVFPALGVKGYKIDRGEEGEMPVWEQNIQQTLFEQLCWETMIETFGNPLYSNSTGAANDTSATINTSPSSELQFHTFARSAFDRSRSRTAVWNGDSHSNFSGLSYSVTSAIRAGIINFPIWGSDTGGYIRDGVLDPSPELWARWMWFSAFSPVFEIMIGTNHTPWYPPYSNRTEIDGYDLVDVLKAAANLHHGLVPYIRSYARVANQTGLPIVRAAFLEAPSDKETWTVKDEYFFGEELFVAPIVNAGGERSVYLPKRKDGKRYLEYFNKTDVVDGGQSVDVALDVFAVPVYVLEGSIVPTGDIYQGNNRWTEDWMPSLSIEVYPSYEVQESTFEYWNAFADESVEICVTTDKKDSSITIEYGDVGAGGQIVVYGKGGATNVTLNAGGGCETVTGVVSLFD